MEMVLKIEDSVFLNSENLRSLNVLINVCVHNYRHVFFCDVSKIEESALFENLLEIDQAIICDYFNRVVTESLHATHVVAEEETDDVFNFTEAIRFFSEPFVIFVENDLYDAFFLDAVFDKFKNKSRIILRHKANGWLRFGNGGGFENIKNTIVAMLKSYENLPKPAYKYLRCYVVVDSDKRYPAEIKTNRIELIGFLNDLHIPNHELEKREMENYLPNDVVNSIEDNIEFVGAYLRLSEIQKDFFDLEKGFPDKNFSSLDPEVQAFYKGVSDEDIAIFRKNNLEFKAGSFKSEFPKLFQHASITRDSFRSRTSHQRDPNELENLVTSIAALL